MQSNTFECKNIYKAFIDEYLSSSFLGWDVFIKHKNIGLKVVSCTLSNTFATSRYIVIDEKKWLLYKLKYGW